MTIWSVIKNQVTYRMLDELDELLSLELGLISRYLADLLYGQSFLCWCLYTALIIACTKEESGL